MVVPNPNRATLADLHQVEGKAELVNGRIVRFMPSGVRPSTVAFDIAISLRNHAKQTGIGLAFPDGIGYAFDPPLPSGREAFSPDASYYTGPQSPSDMGFVNGPPDFAVEVRSEYDYGRAAERDMAEKRADYFVAGTGVVWDVDPVAQSIAVYRASDPTTPVTFGRGDIADAEPAVPGWRLTVDELFG